MANPLSSRGVSDRDYAAAVATAVGEAGGGGRYNQGVVGMAAVIDTLANRVEQGDFAANYGSSIADQAMAGKGKQYNAWKAGYGKEDTEKVYNAVLTGDLSGLSAQQKKDVAQAQEAALGVLGSGQLRGITQGATFYQNKTTTDKWGTSGPQDARAKLNGKIDIGDHTFTGINGWGFDPNASFDREGALMRNLQDFSYAQGGDSPGEQAMAAGAQRGGFPVAQSAGMSFTPALPGHMDVPDPATPGYNFSQSFGNLGYNPQFAQPVTPQNPPKSYDPLSSIRAPSDPFSANQMQALAAAAAKMTGVAQVAPKAPTERVSFDDRTTREPESWASNWSPAKEIGVVTSTPALSRWYSDRKAALEAGLPSPPMPADARRELGLPATASTSYDPLSSIAQPVTPQNPPVATQPGGWGAIAGNAISAARTYDPLSSISAPTFATPRNQLPGASPDWGNAGLGGGFGDFTTGSNGTFQKAPPSVMSAPEPGPTGGSIAGAAIKQFAPQPVSAIPQFSNIKPTMAAVTAAVAAADEEAKKNAELAAAYTPPNPRDDMYGVAPTVEKPTATVKAPQVQKVQPRIVPKPVPMAPPPKPQPITQQQLNAAGLGDSPGSQLAAQIGTPSQFMGSGTSPQNFAKAVAAVAAINGNNLANSYAAQLNSNRPGVDGAAFNALQNEYAKATGQPGTTGILQGFMRDVGQAFSPIFAGSSASNYGTPANPMSQKDLNAFGLGDALAPRNGAAYGTPGNPMSQRDLNSYGLGDAPAGTSYGGGSSFMGGLGGLLGGLFGGGGGGGYNSGNYGPGGGLY